MRYGQGSAAGFLIVVGLEITQETLQRGISRGKFRPVRGIKNLGTKLRYILNDTPIALFEALWMTLGIIISAGASYHGSRATVYIDILIDHPHFFLDHSGE
jgi:hypothetical protein